MSFANSYLKIVGLVLSAALILQANCAVFADTADTPILDSLRGENRLADATIGDSAVLKGGVVMEPTAAGRRVDELTRLILLKEIELEKFNIHYNMEVAKQGRWKGWRYGFFQEANAGTGLAGAIISVAERGENIHSPQNVHNSKQENANFIPMIGAIIGASAAVLEFDINLYHDIEARRKGFSPGKARAHVEGLKKDINSMLEERAALMKIEASAPTLVGRAQLDDVEGTVLADIRDQNLQEFERFHIGARKLLAFQQMQYFFDATKYATNAIGYEFAFLSLHRRHRVWNGRAGTLFIVSGALTMFGPMVSRFFAKGVGEAHRHWLRPTTQVAETATMDKLKQDHAMLDTICKNGTVTDSVEATVQRSAIYGVEEKSFQDSVARSQKQRDKAKLSATQNVGSGLYVGGSKLASGILFAIPGYNHNFNVGSKSFRSNRVTNDLLFAASVIGIPASGYSMLDTLRINVMGEINRHKLMKAGMHLSQLNRARLAQLDDLENKVKASAH